MTETNNTEKLEHKFYVATFVSFLILLISRIIAICYVPVNDYSEARYGEIARKMLETGNWVTPMHTYTIPFWAKPPLSTWLSAFSMKIFGINEFAVRLPGLLLSIGVLYLVWSLAKRQGGVIFARFATLVLAGTLFFFLDAGTVMTDPSLIFCTTLSMVGFWRGLQYQEKFWSYAFFVGLGLGMLAKGPIAVVLVGLPIFFWVLLRNQWVNLWRQLPWFSGTLLAAVIALPWYIIAEKHTPGFLNYFLIGEHFNRFVHPGWSGDKYGHAHNEPWGMIWIFAMGGIFPWCFPGLVWLARYWKKIPTLYRDDQGWMTYILCFTVVPLLFFTFSANIILTYTFPSLPAFALYFTESWKRTHISLENLRWVAPLSVMTGLLFMVGTLVFVFKPEFIAKTQKPIVQAWLNQHPAPGTSLIYWDYSAAYSAEFYAHGNVQPTKDIVVLCDKLSNQNENYVVVNPSDVSGIPPELYAKFTPVFKTRYKDQIRILMHVPVLNC